MGPRTGHAPSQVEPQHEALRQSVDDARPSLAPGTRQVRAFATAVVAVPLCIGTVLVAAGASAPRPGPVLLLALVAALSINHSVFFPSEQAATAEVAVLLAAVTGFSSDAPWLGPLVVALLVGPLDVSHWERRAFLRMGYNAGNRGVAVLAASGAFALTRAGAPDAVAAIAAALTFVAVDLAVSSALLTVQGTAARAALGQVASIDRLGPVLALLGAAAGFAALAVGWWLAALAIVPLAFLPERLIVGRGRARARVDDHAHGTGRVLVAGAALSAALWWFLPSTPTFAAATALLTIAVLVGAELDVDARHPVPPLVAVVVVAATVVVPGAGAYALAPLAAVVTTGVAWSVVRPARVTRRVLAGAVVLVSGSVVAVALVARLRAPLGSPLAVALAAIAVAGCAVLAGEQRRARFVAVGWSSPVLAVALAVACIWRIVGPVGSVVFALWLSGLALAAASSGALPWRGRWSARAATRMRRRVHRAGLLAATAAAVTSAVVALLASGADVRAVAAWCATALVTSTAAVDLVGIRQWRLAPRSRARAAAVAGTAALAGLGAGVALAAGHRWGAGLVGLAAIALVPTGWRPAWCADAVGRAHEAAPRP